MYFAACLSPVNEGLVYLSVNVLFYTNWVFIFLCKSFSLFFHLSFNIFVNVLNPLYLLSHAVNYCMNKKCNYEFFLSVINSQVNWFSFVHNYGWIKSNIFLIQFIGLNLANFFYQSNKVCLRLMKCFCVSGLLVHYSTYWTVLLRRRQLRVAQWWK